MQVSIRFLTFSAKTPKGYCDFSMPDGATAEDLLRAVDAAGQAGTFCAPADWPGVPEDVLLASEGSMLRPGDLLQDGQQISIIGQMIGG
jgi:hypothetical protein